MDCRNYEALISAMLDGELSDEEERALHTHLETCESCRSYYSLLKALQGAPEADAPDPPADLTGRIMASVRAAAPPKKKKATIWGIPTRSLALAAAAAIVILAGWSGSFLYRAKGSVRSDQSFPSTVAAQAGGEEGSLMNGYLDDTGFTAAQNASASLFMDALTEDAEKEAASAELPEAPADDAYTGFRAEDREPVPFTLWVGAEERSGGPDCGKLIDLVVLSSYAVPAPEREPDYTLRDDRGEVLWSLWKDGDRLLLLQKGDVASGASAAAVWAALGVEP